VRHNLTTHRGKIQAKKTLELIKEKIGSIVEKVSTGEDGNK